MYEPILALVEETNGVLNFHDALIALACREREIPVIASFDPDFDLIPWLNRLTFPGKLSS
jgi:predicted nucleic acid-binding protein